VLDSGTYHSYRVICIRILGTTLERVVSKPLINILCFYVFVYIRFFSQITIFMHYLTCHLYLIHETRFLQACHLSLHDITQLDSEECAEERESVCRVLKI